MVGGCLSKTAHFLASDAAYSSAAVGDRDGTYRPDVDQPLPRDRERNRSETRSILYGLTFPIGCTVTQIWSSLTAIFKGQTSDMSAKPDRGQSRAVRLSLLRPLWLSGAGRQWGRRCGAQVIDRRNGAGDAVGRGAHKASESAQILAGLIRPQDKRGSYRGGCRCARQKTTAIELA
jgi:hypothetical protein